jgi:hypothetical protein
MFEVVIDPEFRLYFSHSLLVHVPTIKRLNSIVPGFMPLRRQRIDGFTHSVNSRK